MTMPSIVVDLDDTICFPNHGEKDSFKKYGNAKPNQPIIDGLKVLHKKGYLITINTARRMATHNGDINKIIEDVGDITTEWLHRHQVPYNELRFGKPYGVYYVDDKAMRPDEFVEWTSEHE